MSRVWRGLRRAGRRPVALRAVAYLVIVPLLGGCSPEPDPDPPIDSKASCPADFPVELGLSTDAQEEVEYLGQITACTTVSEPATYINNQSDAVFEIFTDDPQATVSDLSGDPEAASFRGVVAAGGLSQYPDWFLTPGTETVVVASPSDVWWTLDPGLSAMWEMHDIIVTEASGLALGLATDMLAGNSLRRRALIDCSVAAYHGAGAAAQLLDSSQPGGDLLSILAGGTTCARAWQVADEDVERAIVNLSDDVDLVSRLNTRLTRLQRLGKVLFNLAR